MRPADQGLILIVEDDPGVATLEQRRLDRAGFRTALAETADEAMAIVQQGQVDLIVLDYRLPDQVNGLDFYVQLKAAGYDLPVIIVTGFSEEATIIRALRSGVRDFVTKSVEYLDYLPEAVARVLKQEQMEQQLAESEAGLVAMFNSAMDAIVTADDEQRIELFNPAAERMFGCPAEQALGQPLNRFIPELIHEDGVCGNGWAMEAMASERQGLRADGQAFPVEASVSPVVAGGRRSWCIMVRDVSGKKALEAQLLHAQRMECVGRLAGGVAHEFNNFLQAIRGYTQYAMEGLSPEEQRYQDLEQVVMAAGRAATLTRELLSFGRRQVLERTAVDPNQVIQTLLKLVRPLIDGSIEVQVSLCDQVGMIAVDGGQFQQVLMNLCLNAGDAMPNGGRLLLKTEKCHLDAVQLVGTGKLMPGDYVVLTVADTGCGMTSNVRERIFEPFFTTKEVGKGTGLGLAVAYGIVEQHEGCMECASEVDQGTTFKIYMPIAAAAPVCPNEMA